ARAGRRERLHPALEAGEDAPPDGLLPPDAGTAAPSGEEPDARHLSAEKVTKPRRRVTKSAESRPHFCGIVASRAVGCGPTLEGGGARSRPLRTWPAGPKDFQGRSRSWSGGSSSARRRASELRERTPTSRPSSVTGRRSM